MIDVVFFERKPDNHFFSIEELFEEIQRSLKNVTYTKCVMPYESRGILKRWGNVRFALRNKGAINHITGDVHYLGIFLHPQNTVLTIHDCGELTKQHGIRKFLLWLFWFYLPVKRLRYITVISEATKEQLLKIVKTDPDKIRIIPNCLIGEYHRSEKVFNSLKPVILHVGITPNKNINRVAEALNGLPCRLIVLGKLSPQQQQVLYRNKIEFEQHYSLSREEVIGYYGACDLLLFVSTLEGFGLPVIEAQAVGRAVVTSNILPMSEVAGGAACLVDPFDISSIRQGIEKVIEDKNFRERLIEEGYRNIGRFKPENIARSYCELYHEVEANRES